MQTHYCVRGADGKVLATGKIPNANAVEEFILSASQDGEFLALSESQSDAILAQMLFESRVVFVDDSGEITRTAPLIDPRTEKRRQADALRDQKLTAPIPYRGAMFDADATAIRNISGWQTQIAAGVTLPPGFVWRDADNIDHPADADFINGLGAAITLRGSLLYQVAWAHKANIDALPDGEVGGYDVTAGWSA